MGLFPQTALLFAFTIRAGLALKRCVLPCLERGQGTSLPAARDLELCSAFLGPSSPS